MDLSQDLLWGGDEEAKGGLCMLTTALVVLSFSTRSLAVLDSGYTLVSYAKQASS